MTTCAVIEEVVVPAIPVGEADELALLVICVSNHQVAGQGQLSPQAACVVFVSHRLIHRTTAVIIETHKIKGKTICIRNSVAQLLCFLLHPPSVLHWR